MMSQAQFGNASNNPVTLNKSAVAESPKYDGPAGLQTSNAENKFSPNNGIKLAKPGFSD